MKMQFKKIVGGILAVSLIGNVYLGYLQIKPSKVWNLSFKNANSWDNYFTVHSIKEAQKLGKGKGVKVGILDHFFGCKTNPRLYSGDVDFLDDSYRHDSVSEHGYWMANVLKEIAPECEIYALSTLTREESKKVTAMVDAIDWAIANDIDILTYSEAAIKDEGNKELLDKAVQKAHANGIITTFIHYEHPFNIQPTGMYEDMPTDFTIYSYDYNLILLDDFKKYGIGNISEEEASSIFYSESSMSPVTAGFVAILKSINPKLTADQYKEVLVKTAKEKTVIEPYTLKTLVCPKVADLYDAINYMALKY